MPRFYSSTYLTLNPKRLRRLQKARAKIKKKQAEVRRIEKQLRIIDRTAKRI